MTLDEAIHHCYEQAKALSDDNKSCECAKEHIQLAMWLEELKRLRKENTALIKDLGQFL